MGQLLVVPSGREVYPDLSVIGTLIHPQLPPVTRGEDDIHTREAVTIEVCNPDNDALLDRYAEAMKPSGTLPPLGKVCGYRDYEFPREVAGNVQGGFATPCLSVLVAFGDCRRSYCVYGHVFVFVKGCSVGSKIDH